MGDEAINVYDRYRIDPNDPSAFYGKGEAEKNLKNYDDAPA